MFRILHCLVLLALFTSMVRSPASAQPVAAKADRAALRKVLLVAAPGDPFAARLRGQTVDLQLELEVELAFGSQGDWSFRLAAAEQLAAKRRAAAVIFTFERQAPSELVVVVLAPGAGRALVRSVAFPAGQAPDSACLETAALVARGALVAISGQEPFGVERREVEALLGEPRSFPQPARSTEKAGPRRAISFETSAGWLAAYHSHGALMHGPALRLGLATSVAALGLGAGLSLKAGLSAAQTEWAAQRYPLFAYAGVRLKCAANLEARLGLAVGAVLFRRSVLSVPAGIEPAPDKTLISLLVSPEATLALSSPALRSSGLGVFMRLGADVTPAAPEFGLERDGHFEPVLGLWRVAPRGELGFVVLLPPLDLKAVD